MPNFPVSNRTFSLSTVGMTFAAAVIVGYRLVSPPSDATAGGNRSLSQTTTSINEPLVAPWLDLLRQEGRFSGPVHSALQQIPADNIPDVLWNLPHAALTAEDEAGAAAILWRRLTQSNAEKAFDLLVKMGARHRWNNAIIPVFFAAVAHQGWARTQEFLLRPAIRGSELPAITAALPVLRELDPASLNEALAFERSLRSDPAVGASQGMNNEENDPAKQIETLAQADPQAALDLLLTLPEHERTFRGLKSVLERWPEGSDDRLLELHHLLVKPELLTLVEQVRTVNLAKTDFPAALAWIASLPKARGKVAAESIREQLMLGDPAAAHRLLKPQLRDHVTFQEPIGMVERFIQQQPQAARAWAESFPDGPMQATARLAYLSVLARTDPASARSFILSDAIPERAAKLLAEVFISPNAMLDLLKPLPVNFRKLAAQAYLIEFTDNKIPSDWDATSMLELVELPSETTDQANRNLSSAIREIALEAAQTKPLETVGWLQRQPEAMAGPIFSEAFATWVNYADQDALQWLHNQRNFAWQDRALAAAAETFAASDPARAAEFLGQIEKVSSDMTTSVRNSIAIIARDHPDALPADLVKQFPSLSP